MSSVGPQWPSATQDFHAGSIGVSPVRTGETPTLPENETVARCYRPATHVTKPLMSSTSTTPSSFTSLAHRYSHVYCACHAA
ncbi:hypothetical protein RAS1_44080 [Phycisphaerae bacterium RAS1]|nr:hypothetical protein RAS1_44080 [Phycisphaerae bacterium RAS1]